MDCAQDDEDKEEEGEQGPGEQAMAVAEQPAVAGPGKKAKKKGHPLVAAAVQVYISHIYTVLGFRVIAPLAKIIIIFKVKQK